MKIHRMLLAFTLLSCSLLANGPFGFKMGSKPSDYEGLEKSDGSFVYYTQKSPIKSDQFNYFALMFSEKSGLGKIIAYTPSIESSTDGEQVIDKFHSLKKLLTEKYGEGIHYDFLKSKSIWDGRNEWVEALNRKDRVLASYWPPKGKKLDASDNIDGVTLEAECYGGKPLITITYEFVNFDDWRDERNAKIKEAL